MTSHRSRPGKLLLLAAVAFYNLAVAPSTTRAQSFSKYCHWDWPVWDCDVTCPPTGCNCDCTQQCYNLPC